VVDGWQAGDSHRTMLEPQVLQLCVVKFLVSFDENEQLRVVSESLVRVLIK
jgi:hypothetical protein